MNANYVILMYDVKQERVGKVYRVCKKYLYHLQNSVFRGLITESKLLKLKHELIGCIDEQEDFVLILKMINKKAFEEEVLGKIEENGESLML